MTWRPPPVTRKGRPSARPPLCFHVELWVPTATVTVAPDSSSFFFVSSASSLLMLSRTATGALSTISFASRRPRFVSSRTVLMTLILFAPMSVSVTVNSNCSSAASAAPSPPAAGAAATATGAAALTPNSSSSAFTSSESSSTERDLIDSMSSSLVATWSSCSGSVFSFFIRQRPAAPRGAAARWRAPVSGR